MNTNTLKKIGERMGLIYCRRFNEMVDPINECHYCSHGHAGYNYNYQCMYMEEKEKSRISI